MSASISFHSFQPSLLFLSPPRVNHYHSSSSSAVSVQQSRRHLYSHPPKVRMSLHNDLLLNGYYTAVAPSRPVVLSTKINDKSNNVVLGGYDTRMRGKKPAFYAKWDRPISSEKVVDVISGSIEKVYVMDDVRKVKTVIEIDDDMWWDVDTVILDDELVHCSR